MRNKFIKDFAIVIFAYYWALSLINRLIGIIIYSMFPRDPITSVAVLGTAFGLSYLGVWLLFNKWKAKFWIKICVVIGVIIAAYMLGLWIDMNAVYNMPHPN